MLLKKLMFFLMCIYSAARFLGLSYIISTQKERLPYPVYIAAGIGAIFGILLLCKRIINRVKMRELEAYYFITALAAAFNLIFIRCSRRVEATPLDFLIIGTVLDIVVSITIIVLAEKEQKYRKTLTPSKR